MGFSDADTWFQMLTDSLGYIYRNLLLYQGEYVPKGWLSDFPIAALNGSLWTLQPEWMAYTVIFFLAPLFLRSWPFAIATFVTFDLMSTLEPRLFMKILGGLLGGYGFEISTRSHLYLATYLLSGLLFFRLSNWISLNKLWAILAFAVLFLSVAIYRPVYSVLAPVLIPYIALVLATSVPWPWGPDAPDLSYGVYLYGFPLQQLIVGISLLYGWSLPVLIQILIVGLLALTFAKLSWVLVEKPLLLWAAK